MRIHVERISTACFLSLLCCVLLSSIFSFLFLSSFFFLVVCSGAMKCWGYIDKKYSRSVQIGRIDETLLHAISGRMEFHLRLSRLFFFLLYFLSFFSLSRKSIPILFQFYPELSYETLYTTILIRINLSTESLQFVSILFVVDDKNFRWKKLDQKRVVLILLNYSCAVLPSVSVPFHDGHRLFFFLLIRLPFFN